MLKVCVPISRTWTNFEFFIICSFYFLPLLVGGLKSTFLENINWQ